MLLRVIHTSSTYTNNMFIKFVEHFYVTKHYYNKYILITSTYRYVAYIRSCAQGFENVLGV